MINTHYKNIFYQCVFFPLIATMALLTLSGCETIDVPPGDFTDLPAPGDSAPFKEIYDTGLAKYVGKSYIRPSSYTVGRSSNQTSPPLVTWHFPKSDENRGPLSMRGDDYFVETRDGSSDQLLFFMQGGGVCLDEICIATSKPQLTLAVFTAAKAMGMGGVLNDTDPDNPLADYNIVHLPYTDGSIFMGDIDRPLSDGKSFNGTQDMAYQRGLQNLTAGLEVAKYKYPDPSRIVLFGMSAGGFGLTGGLALMRYYYPDTEIVVICDSGGPVLRDNDPDFLRRVMEQLNIIQYIPFKSCPDCIDSGHIADLIAWGLERDKSLRIAFMSHTDDHMIGDLYMKSPPPIFRDAYLRETEKLVNRFGDRVHRFILPGSDHMFCLNMDVVPDVYLRLGFAFFGRATGIDGEDFTPREGLKWTMGGLSETGIDLAGNEVDAYEWIDDFLNDPTTLHDVVNVE